MATMTNHPRTFSRPLCHRCSPIQEEEQTQVSEQRGEGAPRLEPDLSELPPRCEGSAVVRALLRRARPALSSTGRLLYMLL